MKTTTPDQRSVTVGTRTMESMAKKWRNFDAPLIGETIPDGWISCAEFGQVKGWNRNRARLHLEAALKGKAVERRIFKIASGKQLRPIFYYRQT